jgi:hypothetical protein
MQPSWGAHRSRELGFCPGLSDPHSTQISGSDHKGQENMEEQGCVVELDIAGLSKLSRFCSCFTLKCFQCQEGGSSVPDVHGWSTVQAHCFPLKIFIFMCQEFRKVPRFPSDNQRDKKGSCFGDVTSQCLWVWTQNTLHTAEILCVDGLVMWVTETLTKCQ